jgi:hypothetical protein
MNCAQIIDRQKERLSDGCGSTYVPKLLSWLGNCANMLDDRLKYERDTYRSIFEKHYPDHWHLITDRKLPEWIHDEQTATDPQLSPAIAV